MKVVRLVVTFLLVDALLIVPWWVFRGGPGTLWVALEAGFVVGLFLLLPRRRWTTVLAAVTAVALVAVSVLELADTTARLSLARPLNLYLDLHLASSVGKLLDGALGPLRGTLAMGGALLAALALAAGLAWLLSRLEVDRRRWVNVAAGAALLVLSGAAVLARGRPFLQDRVALPVERLAVEQTRIFEEMLHERQTFAVQEAARPASYAGRPGLLAKLGGADVVLAFVESYGTSAVDDPRYAPVIRPRLDSLEARMAAAGLTLATGALSAPTQGGMSWLAHETMLSGLWLDNQLRYDLFMASGRETLVNDFSHAGYRTADLVPAVTMPWPEGPRLGYDEIYADKDIDYRGPPLNWVTMPDQFTWSFLQKHIRAEKDPRPLFTEVSLISSHAPWTPILTVEPDWESLGHGEVFEKWRDAGTPPKELWLDSDSVRTYYARSIAYALSAMTGFAQHYVDDHTLLIVLGDHQPAPLVTGDDAPRTVPVHVISGDPDLVRAFVQWGFEPGAYPDPHQRPLGQDDFRSWFVKAFSDPAAARTTRALASRP